MGQKNTIVPLKQLKSSKFRSSKRFSVQHRVKAETNSVVTRAVFKVWLESTEDSNRSAVSPVEPSLSLPLWVGDRPLAGLCRWAKQQYRGPFLQSLGGVLDNALTGIPLFYMGTSTEQ